MFSKKSMVGQMENPKEDPISLENVLFVIVADVVFGIKYKLFLWFKKKIKTSVVDKT